MRSVPTQTHSNTIWLCPKYQPTCLRVKKDGFIAMWMKLLAFIGAISFMATSLGEYMTFFLSGTDPRVWASLTMILFFGINLFGVRHYGIIQTIMLAILILSILVLVIPGVFAVNMEYYEPLLPKGFSGLLAAMPMLFFSYAGFETLARSLERQKIQHAPCQ